MIKLRSWEYWPFGIVQFPAFIYFLWLSLRARSFVFFSASNPGIPMGGMFGESKFDVLRKIPSQYVPTTILLPNPTTTAEVLHHMTKAGMHFPVILKPDIGERGFMVQRVTNEGEVSSYIGQLRCPLIVQELVDEPLEYGVYYAKYPTEKRGRVISLVAKEMLSVTGDGESTLKELILNKDRAKLQWRKLSERFKNELNVVVEEGKKIELESIGNHVHGTRFINANNFITDQLSETFDAISSQIPGFYFGRFDLRCKTLEDLYAGNVKIMELNGCGAEPGHIYDSEYSLWRAFGDVVRHWHNIYRIARANNKMGVAYLSHREALAYYKKFRSVIR
jgi:hypothetical protein